jgi:transposase
MTPNSASFTDASANGLPAETQYQDHLPQIRRRHNSKERRLEPQITLGLLTDATGFPPTVAAFEGNRAETATMLPVINTFKSAHQLTDVTVVADAGMIWEANQIALQAARGCRSSSAPASRTCPM